MFKKYLTPILLIIISLLSIGLFLYKMNVSPPALNADEAANAYDAYSILKTGKDQYGNTMPLRFKSFGDYNYLFNLLSYSVYQNIWIDGNRDKNGQLFLLPYYFQL